MCLREIRGSSPYKDITLQQCIAKWIEIKTKKKKTYDWFWEKVPNTSIDSP